MKRRDLQEVFGKDAGGMITLSLQGNKGAAEGQGPENDAWILRRQKTRLDYGGKETAGLRRRRTRLRGTRGSNVYPPFRRQDNRVER